MGMRQEEGMRHKGSEVPMAGFVGVRQGSSGSEVPRPSHARNTCLLVLGLSGRYLRYQFRS
jgi:hypothetical protein